MALSGRFAGFFARLFFVYSNRLPKFIRRSEWVIAFHYPEPIGSLRLVLRINKGSDGFIHEEAFEHNHK